MSIYTIKQRGSEKIVIEIFSGRRVDDWEEAMVLWGNPKKDKQEICPKKTTQNKI